MCNAKTTVGVCTASMEVESQLDDSGCAHLLCRDRTHLGCGCAQTRSRVWRKLWRK